jgi:hypothetical protein
LKAVSHNSASHWVSSAAAEWARFIEGCKRPYRAKRYCFFHYKKWRQGELPHSRYRTCSKAECPAKAAKAGLCDKHYAETYKKEGAAA